MRKTEILAKEFSALLRQELGDDAIDHVVMVNQLLDDPLVCASHDHCDANAVMIEAFERTLGREPNMSPKEGSDLPMVNEAWTMASESGFEID